MSARAAKGQLRAPHDEPDDEDDGEERRDDGVADRDMEGRVEDHARPGHRAREQNDVTRHHVSLIERLF